MTEGQVRFQLTMARCRASGAINDLVQVLHWAADMLRLLGLHAEAAARLDEALPLAEQHDMVTLVTPADIGRLMMTHHAVNSEALQHPVRQYQANGDRWVDAPFQVRPARAHGAHGGVSAS